MRYSLGLQNILSVWSTSILRYSSRVPVRVVNIGTMAAQPLASSSQVTLLQRFRDYNLPKKILSNRFTMELEELEKREILHLLSFSDSELKKYELVVARYREAIHAVEMEKKKLEQQINWSRYLLSPIRRIPQEILVEIFSYANSTALLYVDIEGILFATKPFGIRVPLLRVSQVCARWRRIIQSTKSLWSILNIVDRTFPTSSDQTSFSDWIIGNSGQVPLHVHFNRYHGRRPHTPSSTYSGIHHLSSRFESLSLAPTTEQLPLYHFLEGKVRLLRNLDLNLFRLTGGQSTSTIPLTLFQDAPSLTNLTLQLPSDWTSALEIPWHQLTRMDLKASISALRPILRQCQRLLYLRFLPLFQPEPLGSVSSVRLNTLKTFSVYIDADMHARFTDDFSRLFRSLTLPSLEEMKLDLVDVSKDWSTAIQELKHMQERSHCSISTLTVSIYRDITDLYDLRSLLDCFPYLTSLALREVFVQEKRASYWADQSSDESDNDKPYNKRAGKLYYHDNVYYDDNGTGVGHHHIISSQLLSRLTVPSGSPADSVQGPNIPLLPRLQDLTLWTRDCNFDQSAVLQMVQSRRSPSLNSPRSDLLPTLSNDVSPLKRFTLNCSKSSKVLPIALNENILGKYRELKLSGLCVKVCRDGVDVV